MMICLGMLIVVLGALLFIASKGAALEQLLGMIAGIASTTVIACADPGQANVFTPMDSSFKLIFDQEFNGTALDATIWIPTGYDYGDNDITPPVSKNSLAALDPAQVRVSGGSLHLESVDNPVTAAGGKSFRYRTGMVRTRRFIFKHGYYEARIHVPAAAPGQIANWPAFWMTGKTWPTTGEIDILEAVGGGLSATYHTANMADPAAGITSKIPGDFTGWHVFGMLWEVNSIKWYVDGKLVATLLDKATPILDSPLEILLDNSVGGPGRPTVAPSDLMVDYVHGYSKDPALREVKPEAGYGGSGDVGQRSPTAPRTPD